MKMRYIWFVLAGAVASTVFAGPAENVAANARLRADAIVLLRQGKVEDAKQRLIGGVQSVGNRSVSDVDLVQQWVMIALQLRGADRAHANQAAQEAAKLAAALSPQSGSNQERAACFANAGLVCERILYDLPRAKAFYDAAVATDPSSRHAKERQQQANAKLKTRAARAVPPR